MLGKGQTVQVLIKEQSDLGLHCMIPVLGFIMATYSVRNFFTAASGNLALIYTAPSVTCFKYSPSLPPLMLCGKKMHDPSMFTVKAKMYGVLYKQSSAIAFDERSSYWSAPNSS